MAPPTPRANPPSALPFVRAPDAREWRGRPKWRVAARPSVSQGGVPEAGRGGRDRGKGGPRETPFHATGWRCSAGAGRRESTTHSRLDAAPPVQRTTLAGLAPSLRFRGDRIGGRKS